MLVRGASSTAYTMAPTDKKLNNKNTNAKTSTQYVAIIVNVNPYNIYASTMVELVALKADTKLCQ